MKDFLEDARVLDRFAGAWINVHDFKRCFEERSGLNRLRRAATHGNCLQVRAQINASSLLSFVQRADSRTHRPRRTRTPSGLGRVRVGDGRSYSRTTPAVDWRAGQTRSQLRPRRSDLHDRPSCVAGLTPPPCRSCRSHSRATRSADSCAHARRRHSAYKLNDNWHYAGRRLLRAPKPGFPI